MTAKASSAVEKMRSDDDIAIIHVCAGPPACALEGDDAVAAQIAGCMWCRRIRIADDGTESEEGPGHA
jgi:hypothetical protein